MEISQLGAGNMPAGGFGGNLSNKWQLSTRPQSVLPQSERPLSLIRQIAPRVQSVSPSQIPFPAPIRPVAPSQWLSVVVGGCWCLLLGCVWGLGEGAGRGAPKRLLVAPSTGIMGCPLAPVEGPHKRGLSTGLATGEGPIPGIQHHTSPGRGV